MTHGVTRGCKINFPVMQVSLGVGTVVIDSPASCGVVPETHVADIGVVLTSVRCASRCSSSLYSDSCFGFRTMGVVTLGIMLPASYRVA